MQIQKRSGKPAGIAVNKLAAHGSESGKLHQAKGDTAGISFCFVKVFDLSRGSAYANPKRSGKPSGIAVNKLAAHGLGSGKLRSSKLTFHLLSPIPVITGSNKKHIKISSSNPCIIVL
ncbi:MAG: hypothetical protein II590_06610 [Clostridia bacterium]|nr:hypothetical protein [Clostridia bacterium]